MAKRIQILSKPTFGPRKPKGGVPGWAVRFWLPPHHDQKAKWSSWSDPFYVKTEKEKRWEAERIRIELEDQINDYRHMESITFGAYARAWHEDRKELGEIKKNTWKRENPIIDKIEKSCIANIDIKDLDEEDLEQFKLENIRKGYSNSEQRKVLGKTKQILRYAKGHRVTRYDVGQGVDNIKRVITNKRTAYASDEQQILIDAFEELKPEDASGKHIAVLICFETGMRRGEALGLQWRDINWEDRVIDLQRQWTSDNEYDDPKYDSKRLIPLEDILAEWLIAWRDVISKKWYRGGKVPTDSPICTNSTNKEQLKTANFDKWWHKWFVKLGLGEFAEKYRVRDNDGIWRYHYRGYKGRKLHELRHTVITELVGQGSDIKSAMALAGHKNVNTTAGYMHTIDKNIVEASRQLSARRHKTEHVVGGSVARVQPVRKTGKRVKPESKKQEVKTESASERGRAKTAAMAKTRTGRSFVMPDNSPEDNGPKLVPRKKQPSGKRR